MTRALLVALVLAGAGCATLLNDDAEMVVIHSEPAGASVMIDGRPAGVTPLRVPVSSHEGHVVVVSLPGLVPQLCTFSASGGAGWVVLDLLTTSFVGLLIDLVRNEWSSLDQTQCIVFLEARGRTISESASHRMR